MLVLSRKEGTGILIRDSSTGETIEISVLRIKNGRATIGIEAAKTFGIRRSEIEINDAEPSAAESR